MASRPSGLLLLLPLLVAGCALPFEHLVRPQDAPLLPPPGVLYQNAVVPLTPDVGGRVLGEKSGTASAWWVRDVILTGLPVYSGGEASIEAAAREGGLSEVTHADLRIRIIVGAYVEFEVTAWGR